MKITLTLYDNDDVNDRISLPDWPAEHTGIPGMAICKAAVKVGDKFVPHKQDTYQNRCWWHIIHIESGIAVVPYLYSKRDAQEMAVKLIGPNWQANEDCIMDNFDEYRAVTKAARGDYFGD